jgi:ribosomal protein S18 acetylase RimI-like enzyme
VQDLERLAQSRASVVNLAPADWQILRDLRLKALAESPESFLGDLPAERTYDEKHWRQELAHNVWMVATLGTRNIGLAKLNVQSDDGMHLEALWVDPKERRRGVGTSLVAALEKIAARRGTPQLKLWIFTENDLARQFYRHIDYGETTLVQPIKANNRLRLEAEYQKRL